MAGKTAQNGTIEPAVTIDEIMRVLEVGLLLLSVLTPEELDLLQQILGRQTINDLITNPLSSEFESKIGNTSIT